MSWSQVRYRVGQLLRQARAQVKPQEYRLVEEALSPAQAEMFKGMPLASQRHSLDVYHALRQRPEADDELLKAALLHDVGKRGVGLHHRVANVILCALAPGLWRRWANPGPGPLRHGLYALRYHGEMGARRLVEVGESPQVTEIVRRHQKEDDHDPRLRLFREIDEAN